MSPQKFLFQSGLVLALALMSIDPTLAQKRFDQIETEGGVPRPADSGEERVYTTSGPCPFFQYDAIYDFVGSSSVSNANVQVVEGLSSSGCSTRGVLKIALASAAQDPSRRRVLVDLFFDNPSGWVFNFGDSSTNNGDAGDGGTSSNDAEFQGNGRTFKGWYNDGAGSGNALNIPNLYDKRLTLIAGDGQIVWLSDTTGADNYNFKAHNGLFALNGQSDAEGSVNYNLYLGMNKVIRQASSRVGSGLCKVGIKFLPEY